MRTVAMTRGGFRVIAPLIEKSRNFTVENHHYNVMEHNAMRRLNQVLIILGSPTETQEEYIRKIIYTTIVNA